MTEEERSVFVTVGTTSFDELVGSVAEENFMKELVAKGYRRLVLQIGRGDETRVPKSIPGRITVQNYSLKPSIRTDMQQASLIISHGGAGSITEALSMEKPLIVVINEALMNNHQTELAKKMADEGYCLFTTCSNLLATIQQFDPETLTPYKAGDPKLFGQFMDSVMGFSEKSD